MFKNNRTNFSSDITTEDAQKMLKKFNESLSGENKAESLMLYQQICKQMKKRIDENYFNPIKKFIKSIENDINKESCGFIVMGVNCILIELLYELQNGVDMSSESCSIKEVYDKILNQLDDKITTELSDIFYRGIRCGIMHQGQTKKSTAITYEWEIIIGENGKYYLCNPSTLLRKLEEKYKEYWKTASEAKYSDLKDNRLVKKYECILSHIS